MRLFASPRRLRELGVTGMNDRNINLIARLNPRRLYPLVDNKLQTKRLAEAHGIPTPGLIGAIETQGDLRGFGDLVGERSGFAVKPAKGSGGKGILVVTERREDSFVKASGVELDIDEVRRHASNILSGLFSLGGSPDVAVVEDLIRPDPEYSNLSIEGVPDIRAIVYRGFPIMAMMRLSTRASDGKANLHQGAVGVGLALADGASVTAVQFDRQVYEHPDSGADLTNLQIPNWRDLLVLAGKCADASGLGYLGVDVVLDKYRGPLLLELNARPGLAIQICNARGMASRIAVIDSLSPACFRRSPDERVDQVLELFGEEG